MCKWGTTERVRVTVPADLSYTHKDRKTVKKVDKCLASLIRALNTNGIKTRSCCCGHSKFNGYIHLFDNRILIIKKDGEKYLAKL